MPKHIIKDGFCSVCEKKVKGIPKKTVGGRVVLECPAVVKARRNTDKKKAARKAHVYKKKLADYAEWLWKQIVLYRADYKSELSGETGILHCHHVLTKGAHPELKYCVRNGMVLAQGEHFYHHEVDSTRVDWHFEKIRKEDKEWLENLDNRPCKLPIEDSIDILQNLCKPLGIDYEEMKKKLFGVQQNTDAERL